MQVANRGQVVKEYLEGEGVPLAMTKCKVVRRAKVRLSGGEISYPTHKTVAAQENNQTEY